MKVAIIWNFLFHYRIPLYRRLGQVPGVDLTVLHGGLVGDPGDGRPGGPGDTFRSVTGTTRTWELAGAVLYLQTGLLRQLCRGRYDVIVCEGNFGILSNVPILLYARFAGIPVLAWAAGWERGRITGLPAILRRAYIRIAARLARGYICYGTGSRDFLEKYGVSRSRCVVVQNTIDVEGIARRGAAYAVLGEHERRLRGLTHKKIILSVGELRPRRRLRCSWRPSGQ